MILSHQHRFIFVKTGKTAGTSIEIALSGHCGPEDIISPISKRDQIKREALGYPGPQNHQYPDGGPHRRGPKRQRFNRFYNHMPCEDIIEEAGKAIWDEYFTFCVERNPWDRAVSLYYFQASHKRFEDFIQSTALNKLKRHGSELYRLSGEVAVDRILRYEHLEQDLASVCEHLGLPPLELPRAKSQHRPKGRHYRELFERQEDIDRVTEVFADEIALMGYAF